jgi:galactose-1-phosphate uridylyltransferase
MFSIREVTTQRGTLQYREEYYTGLKSRISPDRSKRQIDQVLTTLPNSSGCPFCRDSVFSVTPTFSDGRRITHGESVTFPNLFPFGEGHVVTVITRDHYVDQFSRKQIEDALVSQTEALMRYSGYPSINWNFLPSAGASLVHPHMQGLCDAEPSRIVRQYLHAGTRYKDQKKGNYWNDLKTTEMASERALFGDEIVWFAHAVPQGEREIRGVFPFSSLSELVPYIDILSGDILKILALYRKLGTFAFNMSIFFNKSKNDNSGYNAFCSFIARINPNPLSTSDSAFMERLHAEPVVMTLPEDLGRFSRTGKM